MKIAFIGPGIMPIPTDGWGAVESIIWEFATRLRLLGHEIDIYNDPNIHKVANEINGKDYDFVHSQYDNHVGTLNMLLNKPFATTSHYGYITRPHLWDSGYFSIHKYALHSPGIIALSEEIAEVYRKDGYSGPIKVLRNGSSVQKFNFYDNPSKNCICLGKIEPRKQQAKLAAMLGNYLSIDFVGPIVDGNFHLDPSGPSKYLGTWTREELYRNLSLYRVLILPSLGEAAPLVIPEAQAAGCSIVCTEASTANLDENTPGVRVVKDDFGTEIFQFIKEMLQENEKDREKIRNYSENRWNWDIIIGEYLNELIPFFQAAWKK